MKRNLFDSNALSLFIFRRQRVYERALAARRAGAVLGTGTPIAAEIFGGTLYSDSWQTNLPRVEQALSMLRIWPFEFPAAREYGRVYADLRRIGIQMQAIDRMTAAIALTPLFGLKSIVGMSGGPIFGLKKMPNDEWRYWVVALQSWWDGETKTVYGCPVPIFAGLIADWLERVTDEGLSEDEGADVGSL